MIFCNQIHNYIIRVFKTIEYLNVDWYISTQMQGHTAIDNSINTLPFMHRYAKRKQHNICLNQGWRSNVTSPAPQYFLDGVLTYSGSGSRPIVIICFHTICPPPPPSLILNMNCRSWSQCPFPYSNANIYQQKR